MKTCVGCVGINDCDYCCTGNGKFFCKYEGSCEFQRPRATTLLKGCDHLPYYVNTTGFQGYRCRKCGVVLNPSSLDTRDKA